MLVKKGRSAETNDNFRRSSPLSGGGNKKQVLPLLLVAGQFFDWTDHYCPLLVPIIIFPIVCTKKGLLHLKLFK